jgi:diketogulonate reductase-like aldo/keto reductase
VKRSDLFITSKLNNPYHRATDVKDHLLKSLKDLNVEYLDLWLMHWPFAYAYLPYDKNKRGYDKDYDPVDLKGVDLSTNKSPTKGGKQFAKVPIQETWHAMEECYRQGLVKSIGVANFTCALVYDMLTYAQIKPAVIQIENHPYLQQTSLVKFCQREGLVVEAYSPLGTPGFSQQKKNEPLVLGDPIICNIANTHSKTPAQICLRWQFQRGVVVLPKSVTSDRLKQNIDIFEFELSEDEMNQISTIDKRHHFLNPDQWHGIPLFD